MFMARLTPPQATSSRSSLTLCTLVAHPRWRNSLFQMQSNYCTLSKMFIASTKCNLLCLCKVIHNIHEIRLDSTVSAQVWSHSKSLSNAHWLLTHPKATWSLKMALNTGKERWKESLAMLPFQWRHCIRWSKTIFFLNQELLNYLVIQLKGKVINTYLLVKLI